jgi:hypothetical protein
VRPASHDEKRTAPHPVEWLLIEWPKGEARTRIDYRQLQFAF